eukprot:3721641-Ditylum_brightwellii.AAC.1
MLTSTCSTLWADHAIATVQVVSTAHVPTRAYLGCTQDTFKARMIQHFSDVAKLTSTKKPALAKDDNRTRKRIF